ncbi:unnamed protein product [Hymenolepis diminuta]|uniref:SOSS complex subunit A homolog n=1 Tax=Hymenolepis diminuta TaxID=6216 RepID=A0A564YK22_HYMDI|nr:unnamed protein product [Hymenolepis diminuta]
MAEIPLAPNRLLNLTPIEAVPSYLTIFENAAAEVRKIKETESNVVNSSMNLKGSEDDIKRLQVGLMYIALTDSTATKWAMQDIFLISRDNLIYILSEITRLIAEVWPKFQPDVHKNALHIVDELFATRGANIDLLMMHLLRRINSGDLSQSNLWLAQAVLDLCIKYRESLVTDRKQNLLQYTIFHFLRIIPDHHCETNPYITQLPASSRPLGLNSLFQRESKFIVDLIRSNYDQCCFGREFIRMLYIVSGLPPFQKLWNDIFNDLPTLNTSKSVPEILLNATNPSMNNFLISFEMEKYTHFMLQFVHVAPHFPTRRYQEMFTTKFFSSPEREPQRYNLIRFMVSNIHPTNEMLASSLITRWQVIIWLMSTCKSVYFEQCALSLFFNWFTFQPGEPIMNIEPAVLLLMNGLMLNIGGPLYGGLMEYFLKTANNFHPSLTGKFVHSIRAGLTQSLRLGVIRSLTPTMENLFRFRQDIFREFSNILGSLFEPNLPVSPVIKGLPDPLLKKSGGGGGGDSGGKGGVGSIDESPGTSSASNAGVPLDPRLRRGSQSPFLPLPGNRSNTTVKPRPPSPIEPTFSPPPSPPSEFEDRKRQFPEGGKGAFNVRFPKLPSSPELKIDEAAGMETIQQRVAELRKRFTSYQMHYTHKTKTSVNVMEILNQFDGEIHKYLEKLIFNARDVGLLKETDIISSEDSRGSTPASLSDDTSFADVCESLQNLIEAVLEDDYSDDLAILGRIADVISQVCLPFFDTSAEFGDKKLLESNQIRSSLLPFQMPITKEQIENSLASPVFVPLRSLCEMNRNDAKREILLLLLTEIQIRQPRIGYHLLYFLTVSNNINDEKMIAYKNFCASSENSSLLECLHRDLQLLVDDNGFLFCYLLPNIYNVFASEVGNKAQFIRLIVSKADSYQVNYLISEILRGHLNLFPRSDISEVLKASLDWSTTEQSFFWQLVGAHELPTKHFLPLVSLVDGVKHAEACSQLLLILQLEKPTLEIIRLLLTRAASNLNSESVDDANADDLLSVTSLHYWGRPGGVYARRFAEILGSMITSAVSSLRPSGDAEDGSGSTSSGRKRTSIKSSGNSTDQLSLLISILTHLECMRRNCKNIAMLQSTELQTSLQQVIASSTVPSNVKDRFAELLSLVEREDITPTSSRSSTSGRGSRQETSGEATGSSKGGHSLRNLDSRRAAEAERKRQSAAASGSGSSIALGNNKKKQSCKKLDQDGDGEGEDSSDNANSKTGANSNNDTNSINNANSDSDDDDESEGPLAIDDSLDAASPSSAASESQAPAAGRTTDSSILEITISSSESDDGEEDKPVESRPKKTTATKKRAPPASKKQPPAKRVASSQGVRKVVNLDDDEESENSDNNNNNSNDKDGSDSGDDTPRGPTSKRRKMVSRRLLDD